RPAIAPGEDRNATKRYMICVDEGAAPGHRAGRGSQPRSPATIRLVTALRPAIAPGEDRNLDGASKLSEPGVGCARPSRRARIAPWRLIRASTLSSMLRPAIAPGEDRNTNGIAAHRDAPNRLRPAIAPGEDRNSSALGTINSRPRSCARPSRRARIAT